MLAVQVQYWTLQEAKRHNLAQETQWANELAESKRHNQAQESYWSADIAEKTRHNQVVESQGWSTLSETMRHNSEMENIGYVNAAAAASQAQSAASQAHSAAINAATNVYKAEWGLKLDAMKHLDEMQWKYYNTDAGIFGSLGGALLRGATALLH